MTLVRLTFQQLKKCNFRNNKIGAVIFIRWRGAVRVLLFSLKLSSGANQKKREKVVGAEIFLKRTESGVYHNLLQEMHVRDRESHFRLFVIRFIMNFLAKVIKKNVRSFRVWLGLLSFIKILLKITQQLSKHFPSGLCLCLYLYFQCDKK